MSTNTIIHELKQNAIVKSKVATYCINCKHSYFSRYAESGLCGEITNNRNYMQPKIVQEFHVCDKWEKK